MAGALSEPRGRAARGEYGAQAGKMKASDSIRPLVRFDRLNLNESSSPVYGARPFHIVLDEVCRIEVKEARSGDPVRPRRALLAQATASSGARYFLQHHA